MIEGLPCAACRRFPKLVVHVGPQELVRTVDSPSVLDSVLGHGLSAHLGGWPGRHHMCPADCLHPLVSSSGFTEEDAGAQG